MSFSEIHFLEHEILSLKKQKKPFFTFTKLFIILSSIILLMAVFLTYFLIIKYNKNITHKTDPKTLIKDSIKQENEDNDTSKYKLVAKIEFSDNQTASPSQKDQENNTETNLPNQKAENYYLSILNKGKTEAQKPKFFYEIHVEGLSRNDVEKIRTIVNDKKIILNERVETRTVWNVYTEKRDGNVQIGGNKVKQIKGFKDKDSAIKFAQQLNTKVFIKKEIFSKKTFDINMLPFNSKQEAEVFSQNKYFKGKSLKIIKKY